MQNIFHRRKYLLAPKERVDGVELSDDVEDVKAFGGEKGGDEVEQRPLHATPTRGQEDALLQVSVDDVDDLLADDDSSVLLQTHHHLAQLLAAWAGWRGEERAWERDCTRVVVVFNHSRF